MMRRKNPEDWSIYLLIGAGIFLAAKMVMGPSSAEAALTDAPQPPTQPPVQPLDWPNERVLVIGDSLAVGVQPLLKSAMTQKGVGGFSGIAVGGTNILQWSDNNYAEGKAMEAALANFRPTLVLISLGTNDEASRGYKDWRGRDWNSADLAAKRVGPNASIAAQRAKAIARLARKLSVTKSVWIGPPASPERIWPMDRAFRELIASTWQGRYFDTEAVAPAKAGDGIHFTGGGNRVWADAIMLYLDQR
jgi:lysophospholipase L1-like esterase